MEIYEPKFFTKVVETSDIIERHLSEQPIGQGAHKKHVLFHLPFVMLFHIYFPFNYTCLSTGHVHRMGYDLFLSSYFFIRLTTNQSNA